MAQEIVSIWRLQLPNLGLSLYRSYRWRAVKVCPTSHACGKAKRLERYNDKNDKILKI